MTHIFFWAGNYLQNSMFCSAAEKGGVSGCIIQEQQTSVNKCVKWLSGKGEHGNPTHCQKGGMAKNHQRCLMRPFQQVAGQESQVQWGYRRQQVSSSGAQGSRSASARRNNAPDQYVPQSSQSVDRSSSRRHSVRLATCPPTSNTINRSMDVMGGPMMTCFRAAGEVR